MDPLVDPFEPVIALPEALRNERWAIEPQEWLSVCVSSVGDRRSWEDTYVVRRRPEGKGPPYWVLACASGHVQFAHPKRARAPDGESFHCPICEGTRLVPELTSLAAVRPDIAARWDQERNEPVRPRDVLPGSRRHMWWKCERGHRWSATVDSLSNKGSGCPYCAGFSIERGVADFATTHPNLVHFWDGTIDQVQPHEISARHTGVTIILRCPSGHTFIRTPARLAATPTCPFCEGRALLPGVNDLATTNPEVASWWDYEANGPLLPGDLRAGSNVRAHWRCPRGHRFVQQVGYLCRRMHPSCPVCTGRLLLPGVNDVTTRHPVIATEWAHDLNVLSANGTVPGRGKWWWRCKHGHVQLSAVRERVRSGGCTICHPNNRATST